MLYITLGDQPSGVYEGQVIDVCRYLNQSHAAGIRLVAFISAREFKKNRDKIKARYPKSIVLPMFPKLKNWFLNAATLGLICLLTGERIAICRNVLATNIALYLKKVGLLKKVCYDGRGALAAEWEEYQVVEEEALKRQVASLEKTGVLLSDFRIAVSAKLVHYWQTQYGYTSNAHVVIPCTLSSHFNIDLPEQIDINVFRTELGYTENDLILVYAGSTAGWQSFDLLKGFLLPLLDANSAIKVIFLSREDEHNLYLQKSFPEQVSIKWVLPDEVNKYLAMADYGILLREESVTNSVASPTKFAEYLISGLPVIISPAIGDYTQFVEDNHCGIVVTEGFHTLFTRITYTEKSRLNELAKQHFLKTASTNQRNYDSLIQKLIS